MKSLINPMPCRGVPAEVHFPVAPGRGTAVSADQDPVGASPRLVTQRERIAATFGTRRAGRYAAVPRAGGAEVVVQRKLEDHAGPETGDQWNGPRGLKRLLHDTEDDKLYFRSAASTKETLVLIEVVINKGTGRYELTGQQKEVGHKGHKLFDGCLVSEFDVEKGAWTRMDRQGKDDHELVVQMGLTTYSFHVHPPSFSGKAPIPGELMKNGKATDTQTPVQIIEMILAKHPLPAGW